MIFYSKIVKPKRIHISESRLFLLSEDVFTNKLDRNKKKANITYKKGLNVSSHMSRAPKEAVKTDKMDSKNSDTYIVPLKGGINSYNITDIDGQEIMHYFKRHFSNEKTNLQIKINGKSEDYELEMENNEFNTFLRQFLDKVSFVIYDYVSKHKELTDKNEYTFSKICVYPVKSSSNFNTKIVDLINENNQTIFGLPVIKLNENLLKKDTSKMEKDEDFINKNLEYYNSYREKGRKRVHGNETHMNGLNTDINMFKARQNVQKVVEKLNQMTDSLNDLLINYKNCLNTGNENTIEKIGRELANLFIEYAKLAKPSDIKNKHSLYQDDYTKEMWGKANFSAKGQKYVFFEPLFETQLDSGDYNILKMLAKTYEREEYRGLGNYVYNVQILKRKPLDFQIKSVFNDTRMGMKNFFSFNPDELEKAKKQIEGNILVIFDDNISGGATLSDICAQFVNVGIKHIIPITFGKMFTQWGGRGPSGEAWDWYNLTEPPNGFIFGDNKTFVFRGHTFNTDDITNIMDAANLYQNTFGVYDKEGVNDLWNTYKDVLSNTGDKSRIQNDDSKPLRMAANNQQNRTAPTKREITPSRTKPIKIKGINSGRIVYSGPGNASSKDVWQAAANWYNEKNMPAHKLTWRDFMHYPILNA